MNSGYVLIVGRPNSGKSTLLNNILKHKVSITSPKPQTTRYSIEALYEDERGQIIFIDTPGIFGKVESKITKMANSQLGDALKNNIDVILYIIDHSRERSHEENKIIGVVRPLKIPKILVINKIDIKKPSFLEHYRFLEDEYDKTINISGLYRKNLNIVLDTIYELLPNREKIIKDSALPTPALNQNSIQFTAEIIREKAYLFLRKELPYSLTTVVDEVIHNKKNVYIKARIVTTHDRYKRMIIGKEGRMIKEIGMAARKELETATNQKIYLDLQVEVNRHWYDYLR